ncbi:MAG: 3-phosphoshikimate 1-carboxyvinyltransferase [Ruminococcaceae bacterium]|nr:3-phosphoshikimate 1-carboxyvinyltransferase [Oscillospiraceae bacterium]
MNKTFINTRIKANVRAISSKSEAHRALICAALADTPTFIHCNDTNSDIEATASCLCALGAIIERTEDGFDVTPLSSVHQGALLDCNESGSTLRFLLPIAAALDANCSFNMRGRLSQRPLSPLYELLQQNGARLSPQGSNPLSIQGALTHGAYSIAAGVSSQYISGLLFALSITEGKSTLELLGNIESAPYIEMTLDTLRLFGADISLDADTNRFTINGKRRLTSPGKVFVGGDWSNAAFFLCAGAMGKTPVTVSGLDLSSRQGDKAIIDVLANMGAEIQFNSSSVTVFPSSLKAASIDAKDIPDLVPILATAASVAEGETLIFNAARLRLKESDRIESVCAFLSALGADITPIDDGMTIRGQKCLLGGKVDSANDHRIAMSAAIASLVCEGAVEISRFEAINKSYPSFADNFE